MHKGKELRNFYRFLLWQVLFDTTYIRLYLVTKLFTSDKSENDSRDKGDSESDELVCCLHGDGPALAGHDGRKLLLKGAQAGSVGGVGSAAGEQQVEAVG